MERSRAEPLQGVSAVGSFCVAAFFGQGSPAAFFFSNTLMAVCSRSMPFLASAIALSQPLVHLLNLCVDIYLDRSRACRMRRVSKWLSKFIRAPPNQQHTIGPLPGESNL